MMYFGIDPGSEESAYCIIDDNLKVLHFDKLHNGPLIEFLSSKDLIENKDTTFIGIEMVACYGMAVGAEVFETARWVGRFQDRIKIKQGMESLLIYRKAVKMTICQTMKASDTNIRQAIIDIYGGKSKAVGTKKTPGPLFGISGDCWSALAICITLKEMFAKNGQGSL